MPGRVGRALSITPAGSIQALIIAVNAFIAGVSGATVLRRARLMLRSALLVRCSLLGQAAASKTLRKDRAEHALSLVPSPPRSGIAHCSI